MCLSGYLQLSLLICPPVCVRMCLYVCRSVCVSVCLLVCPQVGVRMCLYVCVSVCLLICPQVGVRMCLYVCMSVCVSVCLLICPQVGVRMCLYHGGETLCALVNTPSELVKDNAGNLKDQRVTFELALQNLPRMARLCILLYSIQGKRGPKDRPGTTGNSSRKINKRVSTFLSY